MKQNNETRELAGWLLCCWKQFKPSSCHGPLHLLNYHSPPSSVDQFLLLIVDNNKRTILHPWPWFPLLFSWWLHVCGCIGKDDMKKDDYFVTILCENWQNTMNSHYCLPQNTHPASYIQWLLREWENGVRRFKNGPVFLLGVSEFGDSCTPRIWVKMGVFFSKSFLGDRRVGVPCHDSDKGWCIIRIDQASALGEFFWTGLGDPVVTMVVSIFL